MFSLHRCLLPVMCSLLVCACSEKEQAPDTLRETRAEPVDLVLVDGRPDPSVLATEQVLYRGNGEEPQTLDPHLAEGAPAAHILRDLFEGLTTEAPDGAIIPGTAIRWNISRDAKTYTLYLDRDGKWSNGDPLTAEDFVFSLQRSVDPKTASNSAGMLLPILNAREVISGEKPPSELGVTSLDEHTLQITLVAPTPYFLSLLAHPSAYPVHRASLEEFGERFSRPGNLVSNGAYVLHSWDLRSSIELQKNPLYRAADQTVIERVIYLPTEDRSNEVKQFRVGALDWTYGVPDNQFAWLQENYAPELIISPWLGSYFFGFNLGQEPFVENPSLRKALVLAIDREVLTKKVTQYGEEPAFALIPPGIGDYTPAIPEYADWTQAERVAEAKRLYEEAGYSEKRLLTLEIHYSTNENNNKIALAVASMWKQVLGVNSTLLNEESKVFLQSRTQKTVTEVFQAGWVSDYNDPFSFLQQFRTGDERNDYNYSNSSFDMLLEQIAQERTPARRGRMMVEAERMLLQDNPVMPIYTYVTKHLVDRHVRGWENNFMDHHLTRYMYKLKSREAENPAGTDATVQPGEIPAE